MANLLALSRLLRSDPGCTFEFSGGTGPRTIPNAQLVVALGSETDFKLRAWFVRSGLRSLNYDEVTVRKV